MIPTNTTDATRGWTPMQVGECPDLVADGVTQFVDSDRPDTAAQKSAQGT
ncbi:MAG: hypothetical protein WDO73_01150 [Ignavibacteriota bacterium]